MFFSDIHIKDILKCGKNTKIQNTKIQKKKTWWYITSFLGLGGAFEKRQIHDCILCRVQRS
jgi:hypothetical protein